MRHFYAKAALGIAAAALLAVQPAQAQQACWGHEQVAAAKIRNLQSRLMVATMRCRAMGVDLLASYNDFVRVNRPTIQAANGVIKAQFERGFGPEGQAQYDSFATALANAYGSDATNAEICADTEVQATEAAAANGDIGQLVSLADRLGSSPALPGGECPLVFASH